MSERPAPPSVVLFDFDGLLVDTERLHFAAYRAALGDRGFDLDWSFEEYCLAAHYGSDRLRRAIFEALPDLARRAPIWEELYADKSRHYLASIDDGEIDLCPGVEIVLAACDRAGRRLAVVTNSTREQTEAIRGRLPALDTISQWITREDYGAAKPAPDAYEVALARCGEPADRAVGLEDTPRGVRALLAAGIPAMLVSTVPYPDRAELAEAGVAVVPSLSSAGRQLGLL